MFCSEQPAVLLPLILWLTACSGLKTYPNDAPANLRVDTETSSDSIFQSVRVALNIYTIDPGCALAYQGTVALDRGPVAVGLPVDTPLYLEFTFDKSARLYRATASTDHGTLFTARRGQRYTAKARYRNDLYQVILRDQGAAHLKPKPLESCKPH